MDKEQLLKRLRTAFLGELEERVRALNDGLSALEVAEDPTEKRHIIDGLFRAAHSLKGAARAVGMPHIEKVCHRVEEMMSAAREGRAELDAGQIGIIYRLVDKIEDAAAELQGPKISDTLQPKASPADGSSPQAPAPRPEDTQPVPKTGISDTFDGEVRVVPWQPDPGTEEPVKPEPASPRRSAVTSPTVRVSAEKLDELLKQSGELMTRTHELDARLEELKELHEQLARLELEMAMSERQSVREGNRGESVSVHSREDLRVLARRFETYSLALDDSSRALHWATKTVDGGVRQLRMLPFAEACHGLRRIVRELTERGQKEVDLVVRGGDIELDRAVLDGVSDALRHLVRNALDHGIETKAQRRAAGKEPVGKVLIQTSLRDAEVEIIVSDDGRGLSTKEIRARARELGLRSVEDSEIPRLIFTPGLSTKAQVTEISGRGVGLDAVRAQLEALHGRVDVATRVGHGTTFSLVVPLTLSTLRTLVVGVAGQHFAIPSTNVDRLVRLSTKDVWTIQGREVVDLGKPVPIASLASLMKLRASAPLDHDAPRPAVLLSAGAREIAVVVDDLISAQELIVKQLGPRLEGLKNVSGGTILPAGDIALIVNVAGLIRTALDAGPESRLHFADKPYKEKKVRILVVDDSATTRSLIVSILAGRGYDVVAAVDGVDAWQRIQRQAFDLVVSDVEMPRMNGFELTRRIRASERPNLPVVLVTTLDRDEDRLNGLEAGANAYIVKQGFDHTDLLDTVADLA